jgi:hypothetical protein
LFELEIIFGVIKKWSKNLYTFFKNDHLPAVYDGSQFGEISSNFVGWEIRFFFVPVPMPFWDCKTT